MADAGDAPYAVARTARLREQRLVAHADRIEADLRLGHPADMIAELTELLAAHPLRERLAGQLMRALAADGRTADALAAYEELRGRLADELGVDPRRRSAGGPPRPAPRRNDRHPSDSCVATAKWLGSPHRNADLGRFVHRTTAAQQPAVLPDQLHRTRRRGTPGIGDARAWPAGHHRRAWRRRQDPAGDGGRAAL